MAAAAARAGADRNPYVSFQDLSEGFASQSRGIAPWLKMGTRFAEGALIGTALGTVANMKPGSLAATAGVFGVANAWKGTEMYNAIHGTRS